MKLRWRGPKKVFQTNLWRWTHKLIVGISQQLLVRCNQNLKLRGPKQIIKEKNHKSLKYIFFWFINGTYLPKGSILGVHKHSSKYINKSIISDTWLDQFHYLHSAWNFKQRNLQRNEILERVKELLTNQYKQTKCHWTWWFQHLSVKNKLNLNSSCYSCLWWL